MNRELYIQTIKKECVFLEEEGYIFNQIENNIYYTKDLETEGFRIRFSWLEFGDKFVSHGLIAEKRFNIVESEIQKLLGGKLENYYTIHKNPTIDHIPKDLEFTETEKQIRFVSNTINDIVLFGEFIKLFYQREVIKFFSVYKDFIDTAISYAKLEREKISTLIVNTGTDIFYRELVIKNKSKAKDENDFVQMVITELEPMKTNSTFEKILNNFKQLQVNLHTNS